MALELTDEEELEELDELEGVLGFLFTAGGETMEGRDDLEAMES